MTAFMEHVSQVVGDLTKSDTPLVVPEGFSLAMYTAPPDPKTDTFVAYADCATDCIGQIADAVDYDDKWDFDAILEMGLPASVVALGENPDNAKTVWVELTIYQ
jgi:hypothetical protein